MEKRDDEVSSLFDGIIKVNAFNYRDYLIDVIDCGDGKKRFKVLKFYGDDRYREGFENTEFSKLNDLLHEIDSIDCKRWDWQKKRKFPLGSEVSAAISLLEEQTKDLKEIDKELDNSLKEVPIEDQIQVEPGYFKVLDVICQVVFLIMAAGAFYFVYEMKNPTKQEPIKHEKLKELFKPDKEGL